MNKIRELMNNLRKRILPWVFLGIYAITLMLFSIFYMPFDTIGWICFAIAIFVGLLYFVYLLMPKKKPNTVRNKPEESK